MAWTTDLVLFVRSLIGDLDATKYNNDRIKQVIAVSAYQMLSTTTFLNEYTVDISSVSISPDPMEDVDFCLLVAYKAAVIIIGGEVKNASNQAISYREGPNSLDLAGVAAALQALYKQLSATFEDLLNGYMMEQGSANGQAILGPYSPGSDFIAFFRGQDHRSNNL
jgi:hypothetical protein